MAKIKQLRKAFRKAKPGSRGTAKALVKVLGRKKAIALVKKTFSS